MKIVWIIMSLAALIVSAGLLAQVTRWPSANPLTLAPIATNGSSTSENAEETMPSETEKPNNANMEDDVGTTNRAGGKSSPPSSSTVVGTVLFDYDEDEPAWYTINDDVMGGKSTSMANTDTETQRLVFSGDLSLENNGGFASIRSPRIDYNLTGSDGIVLRVRGDGRNYQFRIRAEDTGAEIAYTALFETEAGVWKDIYISFEEMVPVYRGVIIRRAPALDPASIHSLGFMLANKQEGEFMLEVEMISAVAAGNLQL